MQAYGELPFLYYARRQAPWAEGRIVAALAAGDPMVLTGLAPGAADAVGQPHCRRVATNVLCAAAAAARGGEPCTILESALIPEHGGHTRSTSTPSD